MNKIAYSFLSRNAYKILAFPVIFIFGLLSILATGGGGNGAKHGTIQLSSSTYDVTEGTNDFVNILVTRSGGSDGDVSVDYTTADGLSVAGSDYTAQNGTLNWADGVSGNQTITVAITDDSSVELMESFSVSLSNVTVATLGPNTSAVVSILDNDSIPVLGTVSGPGGLIAFKGSTLLDRMVAALFGQSAVAGIDDLVSPVPSATVSVFEINADGDLVDPSPITTTTTDGNGSFELAAPLDAPAPKYIVRATGSSGALDSRIFKTNIDVDPLTDAVSNLITDVADDLGLIENAEIQIIQEVVEDLVYDIDSSGANASQLSSRLATEAQDNIGVNNTINSMVAAGSICGTVKNPGAAVLANIKILVRDYIDTDTRARTYTDASGDYCVDVPLGSYIVAAVNNTDDSIDPDRSASEWYSVGGIAYTRDNAEEVTVANTTPVTGIDFDLESGARITGNVSANNTGANLQGIRVTIRDFNERFVVTTERTDSDGNYSLNVIPGNYLVTARNSTTHAYASEIYDGATGTNKRSLGALVSLTVGEQETVNFSLQQGRLLSGTITDGASSLAVANSRIVINNSGAGAERLRTNNKGEYKLWLIPGIYDVYAYGQQGTGTDLSTSDQVVNFTGSVSNITGTVQNMAGTLAVKNVEVRVMDSTGSLIGSEISKADGTFTSYSNQTGNHLVEFKITQTSNIAGMIYNGHTRLLSGDTVNIASVGSDQNLGTINLPDGVTLTGHVYAESFGSVTLTPIADFRVQLRDDDDLTTAGTGNILDDRFQQVRTRSDGSYQISVPASVVAGTYDRIKMRDATGNGNCNTITLSPILDNVLNFYDGSNTCELNP